MEELLAYALLFCAGYDFWDLYEARLDGLFLETPDNECYLYLEELQSPKEAALHILSVMSEFPFDTESFGRVLMKQLGQVYETSDLSVFAKRMYSLWNHLPEAVSREEPFFTFCYADDCLSYGDEKQCRALYERAIHHYD